VEIANPKSHGGQKTLAPNDVMLQFLGRVAASRTGRICATVLTLLLVRRRVFRLQEEKLRPRGREVLVGIVPSRGHLRDSGDHARAARESTEIQEEWPRCCNDEGLGIRNDEG